MLVSIDVTDQALYLAAGTVDAGAADAGAAGAATVKVAKLASLGLPESAVRDGIVKDPGAVAAGLRRLLDAQQIRSGPAVCTIAGGALLARRLELPASKPRELALMVRSEMLRMAGTGGDYVYEYASVREKAAPGVGTVSVWAYALPRQAVDEYRALLKGQRLKPLALDAHQNSIEKLLAGREINGRAVGRRSALFAGVEETGLEVHLFSDGQRAFSRSAPVSAAGLPKIAAGAGPFPDSADFWKGLDFTPGRAAGGPLFAEALRGYLGGIAEELRRMIRFQLRRDAANPVSAIFLYGAVPQAKGLDAALSSALGVPAETIRSMAGVEAGGRDILQYLNAIGALIRL